MSEDGTAAERAERPRTVTLAHRVEFGAVRVAGAVARVLPEPLALSLGALAGWTCASILRVRRKDVDAHLALAFPDRTPRWRARIARASYAHVGREMIFVLRTKAWTGAEMASRLTLVDFDEVAAAARGDGGAVLLTAHLGNWEVAGAGIAAHGYPLDVVAKGMSNPLVEQELFALRERLGMGVIPMSDASTEALRALRRGGLIAMLGDQNAHRHGVFVPFFGREAATLRGTALFPLRTGVPVFVGYAVREPGWRARYTLTAHRLEYDVSGDVDGDIEAFLRAYHDHLESAVRAAPEQYFWLHRRWKTRPGEEQRSRR